MKTTIKLTASKAIVINPCITGGVVFELTEKGGEAQHALQAVSLTPDQVGALIFSLETAAQAAQIRAQRLGLAA